MFTPPSFRLPITRTPGWRSEKCCIRLRILRWFAGCPIFCEFYVSTCVHCGGAVWIVASIEEPTVICAILAHFEKHDAMEVSRPGLGGCPLW